MAAQFDSEQVTVSQTDFCNFELFQDATSRIFETLCHTFGVLTVNAPALRVIAQKGCESLEDAQKQLDKFEFMSPNERLKRVLGTQSAFQFTYCSEEDVEWNGIPVARRRRFNAAAIGQQRQVGFDERLLKRVRMLDKRQSEALSALLKVRSQLPEIPPFAIQFDLEHLYETEFKTEALDMSRFLADTWNWLEETISILAHK